MTLGISPCEGKERRVVREYREAGGLGLRDTPPHSPARHPREGSVAGPPEQKSGAETYGDDEAREVAAVSVQHHCTSGV